MCRHRSTTMTKPQYPAVHSCGDTMVSSQTYISTNLLSLPIMNTAKHGLRGHSNQGTLWPLTQNGVLSSAMHLSFGDTHWDIDKFIKREKNNHQFFIYGPQCEKMRILGYSGGPGWPINNRTGPILLPRHPLTYINLHIKYGSNPIRIF